MRIASFSGLVVATALTLSCGSPKHDPAPAGSQAADVTASASVAADPGDVAFDTCSARYAKVLTAEAAPGAPAYDAHRVEFLGRARGEATVFVREPKAKPVSP